MVARLTGVSERADFAPRRLLVLEGFFSSNSVFFHLSVKRHSRTLQLFGGFAFIPIRGV